MVLLLNFVYIFYRVILFDRDSVVVCLVFEEEVVRKYFRYYVNEKEVFCM